MIKKTSLHRRWIKNLVNETLAEDYYSLISHHQFWLGWDSGYKTSLSSAVLDANNNVFLSSTVVLPEHRGRGLQSKHIQARIRWAISKGAYKMYTYTVPDNYASNNSLIKCGFRLYEPDSGLWAGSKNLYWRLKL